MNIQINLVIIQIHLVIILIHLVIFDTIAQLKPSNNLAATYKLLLPYCNLSCGHRSEMNIFSLVINVKVSTKRKGVKSTQKSDHLVYKNTVPGFVKLSVRLYAEIVRWFHYIQTINKQITWNALEKGCVSLNFRSPTCMYCIRVFFLALLFLFLHRHAQLGDVFIDAPELQGVSVKS